MIETQTTKLLREMDIYLKEEAHKIIEPLYANADGKPTREQILSAKEQYVENMFTEVDEHVSLSCNSVALHNMVMEYLRATEHELKTKLGGVFWNYRRIFQSDNYPTKINMKGNASK